MLSLLASFMVLWRWPLRFLLPRLSHVGRWDLTLMNDLRAIFCIWIVSGMTLARISIPAVGVLDLTGDMGRRASLCSLFSFERAPTLLFQIFFLHFSFIFSLFLIQRKGIMRQKAKIALKRKMYWKKQLFTKFWWYLSNRHYHKCHQFLQYFIL